MKRADFNSIFMNTWIDWRDEMITQIERVGSNAITTGWWGTGLCPHNRNAPYWEAAIAKFGRRETVIGGDDACAQQGAVTRLPPGREGLRAAFEDLAQRRARGGGSGGDVGPARDARGDGSVSMADVLLAGAHATYLAADRVNSAPIELDVVSTSMRARPVRASLTPTVAAAAAAAAGHLRAMQGAEGQFQRLQRTSLG